MEKNAQIIHASGRPREAEIVGHVTNQSHLGPLIFPIHRIICTSTSKAVGGGGSGQYRSPGDGSPVWRLVHHRGVVQAPPRVNLHVLQAAGAKYRLPAIGLFPEFAQAGGLLAYGTNLIDLYVQAGALVGKVLDGARPEDLPIERPSRFQLVVNLKTAKALGLEVPPTLLARADEVIE